MPKIYDYNYVEVIILSIFYYFPFQIKVFTIVLLPYSLSVESKNMSISRVCRITNVPNHESVKFQN